MKIGRVLFNFWKRITHHFHRKHKKHPKFSSSFIQYWYCRDWDYNRWVEEYRMLQEIGITEVILQNIADTKSQYAVYPTKIKGYSINSVDMVAMALSAAESTGMKVRIGLGFNDEWWSVDTHDEAWLDREAEVNILIATEIIFMYAGYKALSGWYIPHEFNPLMALTHNEQTKLNRFFSKIASTIKSNSPKSIMVSPFYNARLSGPVTLTLWVNSLLHTFKDTEIDIIALQDSIGVGFNTLEDLDEIYAYTKKATDDMKMILYTVTETFEETDKGNVPAPQHRIGNQLSIVSAYVRGFVAFSIDHYQNGYELAQQENYQSYKRYCHLPN